MKTSGASANAPLDFNNLDFNNLELQPRHITGSVHVRGSTDAPTIT